MGNLCSSGTERSDKKEENRVPDKPRDGEDEALLSVTGVGLGVGQEGLQVSAGTEEGGGGNGESFRGIIDGTSALPEATAVAKVDGQFAAAAFQKGWGENAQVVEHVQTSAAGILTESAGKVKAAAEEAVSRGLQDVENKVTDAYQSATKSVEGTVGEVTNKFDSSVAANVTSVENVTKNEAAAIESEGGNLRDSLGSWVPPGVALTDSINESVQGLSNSNVNVLQSDTVTRTEDVRSSGENVPQGGIIGNVKEEFGKITDQARTIAGSVADEAKQTAENKLNEAVECVRVSASEKLSAWTETAGQKISDLPGSVSRRSTEHVGSLEQVDSNQESAGESRHFSATDQPELDLFGLTSQQAVHQQVENILQSGVSNNTEDVVNVSAEAERSDNAFDYLHDVMTFGDEKSRDFSTEIIGSLNPLQDTIAIGAQETHSEGQNIPQSFIHDFEQAFDNSRAEEVVGVTSVSTLNEPFSLNQEEESLDFSAGVQDVANAALQSGRGDYVKSEVFKKVGFSEEIRTEVSQETATNETNNDFAEAARSEEDFLEKAKSLLEAHRNSLDEGRSSVPSLTVTDQDIHDTEQTSEQTVHSDESSHEATAREFVESIIEKATSLVSESLEQDEPVSESSSPESLKRDEPVSESSSPSDPSVERGEETLAPKKRGVMFVSPHISDRSSSSLSSPQEISPPPPPQESDLSALADSSSSSISQSELVETEDILSPPSLPAEFSVRENNNNNNNIVNNNAEDDDESIQRVAMEVTAKAVQDAIKIVSENGTGLVINSSNLLNNDIGISSPSSPDNEDEEVTTTDSSQVERGSPVSDITDTSAHGSVSESLSSYDPGAVFRQDVISGANLTSAPSGSSTTSLPETSISKPHDKMADLINFEDGSTSHAETPTPTNATTFDTYSHQLPQVSSDDPFQPFSSDVPSSNAPFDELPPSPNKPTIIINSPDSAHHTNGSCEDMSSSQTEALI